MMLGVQRLTLIFASISALVLFGCTSESSSPDRTSVPNGNDGGGDAGLTEAGVDPSGGRDDTAASCFAACQNSTFTCQAKAGASTTVTEAELTPEPIGCVGTLKKGEEPAVALKLDCGERKVCVGGAPGSDPTS